MKMAFFVDGRRKIRLPSTKMRVFMDGRRFAEAEHEETIVSKMSQDLTIFV